MSNNLLHGLNDKLRNLKLTPHQEQTVRDLLEEASEIMNAAERTRRLECHFGGEQRWREVAAQIDAWGRANLPSRVFAALATTFEGVMTMRRMMIGSTASVEVSAEKPLSEGDLKLMMRDPRYWRDQDPEIVEKVRDGVRKLYQMEHGR